MTVDTLIFVACINFLVVVSPGPDFFLVLKNSLSYSRKVAIVTCFGIITAILVHMSYCIAGIAVIITTSPLLFNTLRYAGALYLIWIGLKALIAKTANMTYLGKNFQKNDISYKTAFLQGFLCNLLNPKATLFFLAIFTQVLNTQSLLVDKLLVALIIWIESVIWWPIVVFIFQSLLVQRRYFKIQFIVDRLVGILIISLGIKVALGF